MESKGLVLVLSTAFISGFAIFINKFGVKEFNPYLFTFLKNLLVSFFLVGLLLGLKEFKNLQKLRKKDWFTLTLIGFVGGSIPFLLFFKGLSLTSAANGAFIHKTMFLYVALLAAIFLKEKISAKILFGALLLLLGNTIFLKILPYGSREGDILVLLATLFWAVENTISKYALKTLSPRIVAFGRMGIGSIFILLFLIFTGNIQTISKLTPLHFQWILISSVILFGYVTTWYTGLKYIPVSVATSILLLGSPITSLLTFFFAEGKITPNQIWGTVLIFAGVITVIGTQKLAQVFKPLLKPFYVRS
jgi:drug/metabolite transporter (DMT)-like permease